MIFAVLYLLIGVGITIGAILYFRVRIQRMGTAKMALSISIVGLYWLLPFVSDGVLGIHIIRDTSKLPSQSSFLDGKWIGTHKLLREPAVIVFSSNTFSATALPNTEEYNSPNDTLNVESIQGEVSFVDYASGAAMLLNGWDPIYIAKKHGDWCLVQSLSTVYDQQIIYYKEK